MAQRKTTKSKSTRKKSAPAKTRKPAFSGIPPQRRIDIFAIILLVIGTLTLVSLFTQSSGSVTGWWVRILSQGIGWGVYLLPLVLIIFGLWMLLRNIESIPNISPERVIGAIFSYLTFLPGSI